MADRPLYEVAAEIRADWRDKNGKPNIWFGAVPYVEALADLDKMTDYYGADYAPDIVMYFLVNAKTWRGPVAKRVKAELNAMLKAARR
jgi:hypothetical protein